MQNDMLRRIAGPKRRLDEDLVAWIVRSSHSARKVAVNAGVKCWITERLRSKWRWAGHVARMSCQRWARKVTQWRDADWCKGGGGPRRPARDHWFRWEDEFRRFADSNSWDSWSKVAAIKAEKGTLSTWQSAEDEFIIFTLR